jgi:hypothetical protein
VLENHYLRCRGQAGPSVQTFFAQEHENQVFCYANANLTRDEQPGEVLRFIVSFGLYNGDSQRVEKDSPVVTRKTSGPGHPRLQRRSCCTVPQDFPFSPVWRLLSASFFDRELF